MFNIVGVNSLFCIAWPYLLVWSSQIIVKRLLRFGKMFNNRLFRPAGTENRPLFGRVMQDPPFYFTFRIFASAYVYMCEGVLWYADVGGRSMLQIYLALLDSEEEKTKFTDIYVRYRGLLFHIAQKYFDSEADQEQVVDETLHAVLKIIHRIDDPASAKTKNLMAVITRNKCIDLQRKRGGAEVDELAEELAAGLKSSPHPSLSEAIASLSAASRDMIGLRYYYGYSTREIGKILGINYDTARKRLEFAHRELKTILVDEE